MASIPPDLRAGPDTGTCSRGPDRQPPVWPVIPGVTGQRPRSRGTTMAVSTARDSTLAAMLGPIGTRRGTPPVPHVHGPRPRGRQAQRIMHDRAVHETPRRNGRFAPGMG